jgi:putative peptidoglycan lipid II flippase
MAARPRRRLAVSTAIFAIATAFSRVAGLLREIVAASFFGTTAAASAFTFASQIPMLMASLFAQAALSSAFVPVFTGLLQEGRKREAVRLASTLFWLVLIGLGALIALAMLLVAAVMPMFASSHFDGSLAAALTEIMFPTVLAMALMGLLAGILQSYDEFSIPAVAPVAWNLVILALLIGLHHAFHPSIYAYAVAWLVATVVQLAIVASALRRVDFRLRLELDWRDPRVRQVFTLMLPVTIGLGILNLDQLINSSFGALVSPQGPRAIQFAFLVYMLPQGIFSVAVSTVLFPTLSRQAARRAPAEMRRTLGNGMRQINLLLIPCAAGLMVLATPITRLVFQHGAFNATSTRLTATALFYFAWSLPFSGLNLLLTRTCFAVRRPWIPTKLAAVNIALDLILSAVLYRPLGIAGLVIGTAVANVLMTFLQAARVRVGLRGIDGRQTLMISVRIVLASALTAGVARGVWAGLSGVLGSSTIGQLASVGLAVVVAALFYFKLVLKLRVPEARQIEQLVRQRLAGTLVRG